MMWPLKMSNNSLNGRKVKVNNLYMKVTTHRIMLEGNN